MNERERESEKSEEDTVGNPNDEEYTEPKLTINFHKIKHHELSILTIIGYIKEELYRMDEKELANTVTGDIVSNAKSYTDAYEICKKYFIVEGI